MSISNYQVILANIHMPRFMNQQIKTIFMPLPMFNDFFPYSASSHSEEGTVIK